MCYPPMPPSPAASRPPASPYQPISRNPSPASPHRPVNGAPKSPVAPAADACTQARSPLDFSPPNLKGPSADSAPLADPQQSAPESIIGDRSPPDHFDSAPYATWLPPGHAPSRPPPDSYAHLPVNPSNEMSPPQSPARSDSTP